jgi:hypothetical protein
MLVRRHAVADGLSPIRGAGNLEGLEPRRPLHRRRPALSGGDLGRRRGKEGGDERSGSG